MQQNAEFLSDSTDFYTPTELKAEKQDYPSVWFTLLYEEQSSSIVLVVNGSTIVGLPQLKHLSPPKQVQ